MISMGVEFCEEKIERNEYESKLRFSFPFYTDDPKFLEARNEIFRCKDTGEKLYFPDITNDDQLSFKDASDIRFKSIRRKFPKKERW